ncbi:hypothetical protein C8J57DRAFT_1278578 [Mycena rebaudengoi]|nr:hypothetical protein C8J57DRAFT_1278578 [Mycena rebaudengoi]
MADQLITGLRGSRTCGLRTFTTSALTAMKVPKLCSIFKRRPLHSRATSHSQQSLSTTHVAKPADDPSAVQSSTPHAGLRADNKESSSRAAFAAGHIDKLAVAANIVERIATVVDSWPFVAPVAALLSEILKTCREVNEMHEQKDTLVIRLAKIAEDIHGTIMRMEVNNYTDGTGRLKKDTEEYVQSVSFS